MACLLWATIFTAITLLYMLSAAARYYMKFTLFAIVSILLASVPIPLMLPWPKDSRNALIPAKGLSMLSWLFGIKWEIKGNENIIRDSGSVVLINHQSALDLCVLAELWPILGKCTVISKREIFYIWPFGLACWLWGTIFIDRLNGEKAQESVNTAGRIIRENEQHVLMFPEGTRNDKDKLLPFKKGGFHLALASQCPIQPVVVSKYKFLGNHRFDSGSCTITILPRIETKGLAKEDLVALMDKTYNVMSDCVNQNLTNAAKVANGTNGTKKHD